MTDQWVTLVARLNQLTAQGELKWELENEPTGGKSLFFNTTSYVCKYQDKGFRVSRRDSPLTTSRPETYQLHIVDSERRPVWDVPADVLGIKDLYETVRYKTAGVDELIKSIVGKK